MPAPRKTLSPTAIYLEDAIAVSGLTQREIADGAGFPKPNMLSMMKTGDSKVPIDRIPALARVCGVNAARFIEIAMREYHPEVWDVLMAVFGETLTQNRQDLVLAYELACPKDEILITDEVSDAVIAMFVALKAAKAGNV